MGTQGREDLRRAQVTCRSRLPGIRLSRPPTPRVFGAHAGPTNRAAIDVSRSGHDCYNPSVRVPWTAHRLPGAGRWRRPRDPGVRSRPRTMTKDRWSDRLMAPPPRWMLGLAFGLLCLAGSRVPVASSVHRFGSVPTKRSRRCITDLRSGTSFQVSTDRCRQAGAREEIERSRQETPELSFQALSLEVESRLALGQHCPDYLKPFAASASHRHLSPPPSAPGAAA